MSNSWRQYLQLSKKKVRHEKQQCIVEGVRICEDALVSEWEIQDVFITEAFTKHEKWQTFLDTFDHRKINYRILPDQHFKRLADTDSPQGIIMVLNIPSDHFRKPNWLRRKFVLALEGIRDPGNMGTLIRTAEWYGVQTLLLSADCVDPYNPKVIRSTMGSIFRLPIVTVDDFVEEIRELKENHFWLVGASLTGNKTLHNATFRKPIALLLGNEGVGLSDAVQREVNLKVRIWRYGEAESLNVGVAGGIFLDNIAHQLSDQGRGNA